MNFLDKYCSVKEGEIMFFFKNVLIILCTIGIILNTFFAVCVIIFEKDKKERNRLLLKFNGGGFMFSLTILALTMY